MQHHPQPPDGTKQQDPTVVDGPIRGRSNAANEADISRPKDRDSYIQNPPKCWAFQDSESAIGGGAEQEHEKPVRSRKEPADLKGGESRSLR